MRSQLKTSVIIPNWNGLDLLADCLTSLSQQIVKNFEVIIVDNGSSDGSIKYIEENFPKFKIIKLDKNYGFAKAVNIGFKKSNAEFVVVLNNDTKTRKDWLQNLIKAAEGHKQVFAVCSKLLNFYNPTLIDGVGVTINEVGQAKSLGFQKKDGKEFSEERYVFGVTGGAALFRRDLFLKLGGFDEKYFMYFEDLDLSWRAQLLGYKSIYCPSAVVYHKHKASSKKRPQHLEYWQYRNMIATVIKDFPASLLLRRFRWLKILLVHVNTFVYQIKNGFIWPALMVQIWLLWNLPYLLSKRVELQSQRKVSDDYLEQFLEEKKITFWGLFR